MAEVEEMCERVIFLQKGRIVASGTPEELKRAVRDYYLEVAFALEQSERIAVFLTEKNMRHEFHGAGHLRIKTTADDLSQTLRLILQQEFGIYDIDINKPDLEEVFLKIARR